MILDMNLVKDLKEEKVRDYIKNKIELDKKDFVNKFLQVACIWNFHWFKQDITKESVIETCAKLIENALNNPDAISSSTGHIHLEYYREEDDYEDILEVTFLIKP